MANLKNSAIVKSKLAARELTLGSWITFGHPGIGEVMARAGFDWVAVDLEHSAITIKEMADLIRVIDLNGSSPLVRVYANDTVIIKRALDAGAHGVIVPMINSAKDAEQAVGAAYYPPRGFRGVGLARAQDYGVGFESYRDWASKSLIVVAQIEHIQAVENLESILAVDGIDGYILGPYDLSASLGIPGQFSHPDFLKALEKVRATTEKLKKSSGIHVVEPDTAQLKQRVAEGFTFIAYGVDFRFLDRSCRDGLTALKEKLL